VQRLAYASEARLYGDWGIEPLTQTLDSLVASFATHTILKAVETGIVGSVRAAAADGACRIGRLLVHPGCQGRGLGTALLAAIEAEFPSVQRYELFTGHLSAGNLRLYGRLGYHPVRTERVSAALSLVFMEKRR